MTGRRIGLIAVIALALAGLIGTAAWAAYGPWGPGDGMMRSTTMSDGGGMMGGNTMMDGDGMMDGAYGLAGAGPVATLGQARTAAERYADRLDLRVGEVMQFDNGFYAELSTPDGSGATEVLVDTDDGDVRIEYGPAMMWNTEYGMHASGSTRPADVTAGQARRLADEWLTQRGDGLSASEADAFPGYYTLHTLESGKVDGMLSVNASTGAVWYHTWHGEFVDMSEE